MRRRRGWLWQAAPGCLADDSGAMRLSAQCPFPRAAAAGCPPAHCQQQILTVNEALEAEPVS